MHWAGSSIEPIAHPEWYLQVSPQIRADYLSRAILWEPQNIAQITPESIRLGEPSRLKPDTEISCTYLQKTHKELEGNSPKFECQGPDNKIYRIKYGVKAHTTVAASRLLWALGFGAAISTPVHVICTGCSPDPWNKPKPVDGKTTFNTAVIQEMKEGKEITIAGLAEVGWSWKKDLPLVSEEDGGATRAQVDALRLIAVLIQHGDSKPAQQKLICRPQDYDANTNLCLQPYMYVYDLGKTFGSDGMKVHPLDFERWKRKSVFTDKLTCIGNLRQNIGNGSDGLTFPRISEEGRLFLANLLSQFISDRSRVVAMFAVAHMDVADPKHSADDWADVFISKAMEISAHPPCPPKGPRLLTQLFHVKRSPMAAANIVNVANQPSALSANPLARFPITFRLLETSIRRTRSGGATNPFTTAVQNRAGMGLIPTKLMSTPTSVDAAINRRSSQLS